MNNKALLTLIIFSITNIIDASPLPIPEINYEKFTLNNGLTVVVQKMRMSARQVLLIYLNI